MVLLAAIGLAPLNRARGDDLFQLSWSGTYYTTNQTGHIIARPFTEQDFINTVAQNNGLDPSQLLFAYRPNKRDCVVVRSNGAFVANVVEMEFTYTDVNNPSDSVTVRGALLYDEAHEAPLGSFFGLETRARDAAGNLLNSTLVGTVLYSKPDLHAVYSGRVKTGRRIVDSTGAP